MHGLDIFPAKAFKVRYKLWVGAIALEHLIKLKILQLCDGGLSLQILAFIFFNKGNIFNDLHAWRPK
jgi:hypothetical protein